MIITVIVFIIVLSILVLVHELGHFLAAKKFGIMVEEFGFGLPPRIFGKKIGETIYSVNILPIGGFVRLYGEEQEVSGKKKHRSFLYQSRLVRLLVIVAGVTMNFFLGAIVISYIFTQGILIPTNRVHIESISENSPAGKAGLMKEDVVLRMSNYMETKIITNAEDLISFTNNNLGKKVQLSILRCVAGKNNGEGISCKPGSGPEELTVSLIPRKEVPEGEGPMGISISNLEEKKYSLFEAPIRGIGEALTTSWKIFVAIINILWKLITQVEVPKDVAGPIGVAQITSQAMKFGPMAILELIGFLSLNLAVVNILPIPALDGGRLLFIGVELVFGKKVRPRFERVVHQIGMVILLTLIFLVTLNDIRRIITLSSFNPLGGLLP
jgi:regulator of sigma E protease